MNSDPASKPSKSAGADFYIPWTVSVRMMERRCGCHKWQVQDANLEPIDLETCILADYGKQYLTSARASQEGAERAA